MSSEIRNLIDQVIPVINDLRDTQVSLLGTTVLFRIPTSNKADFDLYGDVVTSTTYNLETQVIIKWGDYRSLLTNSDPSAEENLSLEMISKIRDDISKGSKVDLTYVNHKNVEVTRTFVVIGVEDILENREIGRKLTLVPVRH